MIHYVRSKKKVKDKQTSVRINNDISKFFGNFQKWCLWILVYYKHWHWKQYSQTSWINSSNLLGVGKNYTMFFTRVKLSIWLESVHMWVSSFHRKNRLISNFVNLFFVVGIKLSKYVLHARWKLNRLFARFGNPKSILYPFCLLFRDFKILFMHNFQQITKAKQMFLLNHYTKQEEPIV